MARGGSRAGSGRKKGAASRKTKERLELIERATAEGVSPLAHMLQIMNDTHADTQRRDYMAKAAAPYCHARLSARHDAHTHAHASL